MTAHRWNFRTVATLGCWGTMAALAADLTLVRDGVPAATIVVSEAALAAEPFKPGRNSTAPPSSKIKLAALDLRAFVAKMSGATLPIVSDGQETAGAALLVGPSRRTVSLKGLKIPSGLTPERSEEGYVLWCRGDTLVLAGNDEGPYHGTHNAVAEFLNRQGVRWILPGDFGEVVPQKKTLTFGSIDWTDRPAFRFRTWWCNQPAEMGAVEALWKVRNKMQVADMSVIGVPGDSYLRQYMPDPALVQTQPEVFGRRLDQSVDPHMPNLSNPEAARLVADKVIERIRKSREAGQPLNSLGFAPDDGLPMDHTPQTMKDLNQGFTEWVGREGVPTELSVSEEWFTFVNRVTEHVVKVYPEMILSTNGYANRCIPPEGVRLHPNLAVMYAPIWADTLKPFFTRRGTPDSQVRPSAGSADPQEMSTFLHGPRQETTDLLDPGPFIFLPDEGPEADGLGCFFSHEASPSGYPARHGPWTCPPPSCSR
ncbi:MAG: DUF4838 domain-containing protein [Planctomycetes bacterium]|nr:DUF4838 domain-containing protein [Planctomycetota bacterium]